MRDIFWHITTFDCHNSLPFIVFDAPLRPLVSVARARYKVRHIVRLILRGAIAICDLPQLLSLTQSYFGPQALYWTIDALIDTFREHATLVPAMFEVLPFVLNGKVSAGKMIQAAIYNVYNRDYYVPSIVKEATILCHKLEKIEMLKISCPNSNIGSWDVKSDRFCCINYCANN